ncbi:MAG: Holliday junction branch migration protein RuvA [Proteobacteria bacterium]|nr:Holliday junction branch migration protein RuvA [Pseudomonadota bacterium]
MISFLKGVILSKKANSIVVDVGGVGYLVFLPLKAFSNLPELGKGINLHIQTVFNNEEGFFLYGFLNEEDKEVFNLLRQAKGIGAKTAFSLLSFFDAGELINFIENGSVQSFLVVPGIGKKTAERIIFELKDKVKSKGVQAKEQVVSSINMDAELALVSLGYSNKEAREAVLEVIKKNPDVSDVQVILKEALKFLMKR